MKPQCASPGSPRRVRPLAAPFPPLGPPRRVPQLQRYYGAVRLPVPLSPRSVAFAWRYPAARLSIRSQRPRTPDRRPGVRVPVPTTGMMRREAGRASQVPGQPKYPYALFFDPGRTETHQAITACRHGPRYDHNEGSHESIQLSRLNGTALGLAVYASSGTVARTRRKTRFRPLARRYRTGLVTRRVVTKGF